MKVLTALLLSLSLLTACHKGESLRDALYKDSVLIVSHRGVMDVNSPENSLTEMEKAFQKGIRFFEIDVRENAEGQLYLLHDERLDRTTTGRGLLLNFSKESLEGIYIKETQEQIPTFSAALEWAKKRGVWLMLDVKTASLQKVLEVVQKEEMEQQILLLTFTNERTEEAFSLAGDFLVSVLIPDEQSLTYYRTRFEKERLVAYIPKNSASQWFLRVKSSGLPTLSDVMGEVDARANAMGRQIYSQFQESRNLDVIVSDFPLNWQK
jgi:glycerophosphoryl diester phosphodiesterase